MPTANQETAQNDTKDSGNMSKDVRKRNKKITGVILANIPKKHTENIPEETYHTTHTTKKSKKQRHIENIPQTHHTKT